MYYHGFGCEATSDGVTTDSYPWMKCYDPSVPVLSSAEGVTDAQIENANAVLDGKSEVSASAYMYLLMCGIHVFLSQSKP